MGFGPLEVRVGVVGPYICEGLPEGIANIKLLPRVCRGMRQIQRERERERARARASEGDGENQTEQEPEKEQEKDKD